MRLGRLLSRRYRQLRRHVEAHIQRPSPTSERRWFLIVADGFFEWKKTNGGKKQPTSGFGTIGDGKARTCQRTKGRMPKWRWTLAVRSRTGVLPPADGFSSAHAINRKVLINNNLGSTSQ